RLQTAGGAITSPMYRVEEFYLGANKLSNVAIMLLEDENLGGNDGLLGMNVLSKFDFVASQTSDDVFLVQK
ncbi:MAG: aspartyl protease family protein, partial [Pseudomonadota bacterium]